MCGLQVSFGDFTAVQDLTFEVQRGEFLSIVGRSGCGKTSLFNAVAGLLKPYAGTVEYRGDDVSGRPGHAGYMLQRDHLFPWKKLLDNVVIGLDVLGSNRKASREKARALLPRFGLEGFQDAYPGQLSGGMKQRAALLRTVLLDRDLLLLDEPFGALDAITRGELQAWLLDLCDELQKTVLFITHDVEEAIYLSDRVMVMNGPPGHIADTVAVDIPRPRHFADVVTSQRFTELKHRLLDDISAGRTA
ncbi:ABC transporter ATP-binding protein [Geodermatophilus sp. DF01_2]|uniref:ABC transporter ATP-binding protein n=1 Tax=Geodermatophilus sp. DF01-2 TaxID=2559610 RepID=UPI00142F3D0A|nr:ABC transporter ATP-binding protein [Geodermatophilus sp. DF01_2]